MDTCWSFASTHPTMYFDTVAAQFSTLVCWFFCRHLLERVAVPRLLIAQPCWLSVLRPDPLLVPSGVIPRGHGPLCRNQRHREAVRRAKTPCHQPKIRYGHSSIQRVASLTNHGFILDLIRKQHRSNTQRNIVDNIFNIDSTTRFDQWG